MVTGLRPVADARARRFDDEATQAAWTALDCGFAAVAEVFAECLADAAGRLDAMQLDGFLACARQLGKLGRGAEPVLAFLEQWPATADAVGPAHADELLEALMVTVGALQRSPNGKAIAPLISHLTAVASRLQSVAQTRRYLELVVDLMQRTSVSIHGRQATIASPGLPAFLAKAPELLGVVAIGGLRNWVDAGIRLHGHHPDQQAAWFALDSDASRAVLQRERHGLLLVDCERSLGCYAQALWNSSELLVPFSTAFADDPRLAHATAWYDDQGIRLPDVLDDVGHVAAIDRYRLRLAHMFGHRRWSTPLIADNWSPQQRLAVEAVEDCRIDTLLLRRWPGLRASMLALHPAPSVAACDDAAASCLRHRLTRLSRALLDPAAMAEEHVQAASRFAQVLTVGEGSSAEMATIALEFVARTRRQSDQSARVHFDDTVVDYRDDNRHLWRFIEAGDEEETTPPEKRTTAAEPAGGLPPRRYPEWDEAGQTYRPDWVSVYEALHPAGNAADIDALLARHATLARRLQRVLDALKPQERVRERFREDGSELDLDVAVRAMVDMRAGTTPDPRINMSHRTDGRNVAVSLLLDLSESLNAPLPGQPGTSVLDLSREAVALAAWAIDRLGDPCAIAGFHSNTRHDVRFWHIKGYGETWDAPAKARLAALGAGWSTRMGAALRHAGRVLAHRRADKRILLLLTDGEPADVDVADAAYLRADARRAVAELAAKGVTTYCLSLDAHADDYVREIFGHRWRVLDRIERLPEELPKVYLSLTR